MSLVSDSLRKARRERAEQVAREQGVAPPLQQNSGGGPRFGVRLVLVAAVTVVAGLVGGLVVWWLLAPGAPVEQASTEPAQTPVVVVPKEAQPQPESQIEPGSEAAPAPAATAAPTPSPIPENPPEQTSTLAFADPLTETPTEAAPRPRRSGSREFVGQAEIGGVSLTLGYLVYRESDPFAEINDMTVFVGTIVEGFRVDEIRRDRVVLSNQDGPMIIKVR